jgi:uncharacterized protein with HEPN domain
MTELFGDQGMNGGPQARRRCRKTFSEHSLGQLRGIGNWLWHQYDSVDPSVIWQTAEHDLPPLKFAVGKILASSEGRL